MATVSFLGVYEYDNTIFDYLTVPESVVKNTVVNLLLFRSAELELLYSDPALLKMMLQEFSTAKQYSWYTLSKTIGLDYDPISNYDRKEDWTDTESTTGKDVRTGVSSQNGDVTETSKTTEMGAVTNTVAAYNTNNLSTASGSNTNGNSDITNNSTSENSVNVNDTTERTDTKNITRTGRAYGNIGVTTTQQMIQQERDIAKFSIYDKIVEDIMDEFCLLIY